MSWSLTCSFLFILLGYSCDTRELAIASTCQWREDVDAGNWKCYSRMRFCSRTGCLKHVFIDTQFQGAETCFKDCMWWCCVSWGGLYQTSCLDGLRHFFLVLCSVCVHDESNLVSLQNQGADFVNAVWVLSKCIAQENFNTLDNICSLHICLHMPWWSVVAPCLATTIFTATSICRKRGSRVLFDSNRFHCGQADSSSSESACAVFECNVDVVVLWFCHIQMSLVCLVPFLNWNHWKSLVRIHLHMRWTVFEQPRNWDILRHGD
jgi:hypothetical protein